MRRIFLVTAALAVCIAPSVFAFTTDQAEKGEQIFLNRCAECHGVGGAGGVVPEAYGDYAGMEAPPVVGKEGLPHMKTVANVYAFIKAHMPLQKPGSLSEEEALNLVAFDLMANGVAPDGQPLTVEKARGIKLPEMK